MIVGDLRLIFYLCKAGFPEVLIYYVELLQLHRLKRMEFITCKLCSMPYDEKERQPCNPACGHEFCSSCITAIISNNIYRCPKCQVDVNVHTVEDLTINFALIDAIKALNAQQIILPNMSESKSTGLKNCELCKIHMKAISHRCETCLLWICIECIDSHFPQMGCTTIILDDALRNLKEKQNKEINDLMKHFENETKHLLSEIQEHSKKRKEYLDLAEKHGEKAFNLQKLLEEGNNHKEKLIESENYLKEAYSVYTITERNDILVQRKQILRSWSTKRKLGNEDDITKEDTVMVISTESDKANPCVVTIDNSVKDNKTKADSLMEKSKEFDSANPSIEVHKDSVADDETKQDSLMEKSKESNSNNPSAVVYESSVADDENEEGKLMEKFKESDSANPLDPVFGDSFADDKFDYPNPSFVVYEVSVTDNKTKEGSIIKKTKEFDSAEPCVVVYKDSLADDKTKVDSIIEKSREIDSANPSAVVYEESVTDDNNKEDTLREKTMGTDSANPSAVVYENSVADDKSKEDTLMEKSKVSDSANPSTVLYMKSVAEDNTKEDTLIEKSKDSHSADPSTVVYDYEDSATVDNTKEDTLVEKFIGTDSAKPSDLFFEDSVADDKNKEETLMEKSKESDTVKPSIILNETRKILRAVRYTRRKLSDKNYKTEKKLLFMKFTKSEIAIQSAVASEESAKDDKTKEDSLMEKSEKSDSAISYATSKELYVVPKNVIPVDTFVYLKLTNAGEYAGRITIQLSNDIPNIKEYMINIMKKGFRGPLSGISMNIYCINYLGAILCQIGCSTNVLPDKTRKYTAKRGDVCGNFEEGYLKELYFSVAKHNYTHAVVFGSIVQGFICLDKCHTNHEEGVSIKTCGLE